MLRRLIALARPKGAWLIACLPLGGLGFGLWERGSQVTPWEIGPELLGLWISWLFGHAGAMWLNAVLDQDEGQVLFGHAVPVPAVTGPAGYVALVLSVSVALWVGPIAGACALACALMSILYSHPKIALKGRPIGGPLINGIGYGMFSPIAGWSVSGTPLSWRAVVSLVIVVVSILGVYFAAQAFQADEDRERGYRTFVVLYGPRRTLIVARMCIAFASVSAMVLVLIGVYPRAMLLLMPLLLLSDRHIGRWMKVPAGGSGEWATRLVRWLTLAALTTLALVYADHFVKIYDNVPAGGCGTAVVPDALDEVCWRTKSRDYP